MNMETNFIALVPGFKFERRPTFVLTCDAAGLRWLRDAFLELVEAESEDSFIVGDGIPIAHTATCSGIIPDFIWTDSRDFLRVVIH